MRGDLVGTALGKVRREMPPGPLDWRATPKRIYSRRPRRVLIAAAMGFLCLVALFLDRIARRGGGFAVGIAHRLRCVFSPSSSRLVRALPSRLVELVPPPSCCCSFWGVPLTTTLILRG